jgi:RNA polymerase sigma-70 factor, ECF subfamily
MDWQRGESTALEKLMPLVYDDLHRLAGYYMRHQRPGHVLQSAALVNAAYLQLVNSSQVRWQNRIHFFAVSAQIMRRILVDFARSRGYLKRGGGMQQILLNDVMAKAPENRVDLLALDEALTRLSALNARQAQVVELRYFGGLNEKKTAEALRVSVRTVQSDWRFARLWLYRELRGYGKDDA